MNQSVSPSTGTILVRVQNRKSTKMKAMAHVVKAAAIMLGPVSSCGVDGPRGGPPGVVEAIDSVLREDFGCLASPTAV
jgi:hypothetical protein